MNDKTGWLLDLFETPAGDVCSWFIGEDGTRFRVLQQFPITFFMGGNREELQGAAHHIKELAAETRLEFTERYDLFSRKNISVLSVQVQSAYQQPVLFRKVQAEFPDLDYYNADIQITLRHAAVYQTFPLSYCRILVDEKGWLKKITVLDCPWDIQHAVPPLRILRLEPDEDPQKTFPRYLTVFYGKHTYRFSFNPIRALLINLRSILEKYDPDIIQTRWGDTWLLPTLTKAAENMQIALHWNRELGRGYAHRPERSYFSYGQIVYRGQQMLLFGRAHIDCSNAMFWNDYALEGIFETARVTRLPLQQAARQSSGTGISSMQIVKALENDILVPYQKQQSEDPKSALELLQFDQGGLVYQPLVGTHSNVGEIDFISMYPSIMVRCNISPETDPSFTLEKTDDPAGLIPQTLAPLLQKRIELKQRLADLPDWDPLQKRYKQQASAQKWLLVTCFGYLGYKNARFGRIEAHEAITANGREALLRAKEAAEEMEYQVLHMYVDGLWVQQKEANITEDFQDLLEKIAERTGLSVSLNGIYRWVAFLPSRVDERVPVANRYFGVFQDGSIKMRGIETRRHDTPNFIAAAQLEILEYLAKASTLDILMTRFLPGTLTILRRRLSDLYSGRFSLEDLTISHRLSRELNAYQVLSAAARAHKQLIEAGKKLRPGQRIRFLYTRDKIGVYAWDLPQKIDKAYLDIPRYCFLLLQAAETILKPFGWDFKMLETATGKIPAVQYSLFDSKERKAHFPAESSDQKMSFNKTMCVGKERWDQTDPISCRTGYSALDPNSGRSDRPDPGPLLP